MNAQLPFDRIEAYLFGQMNEQEQAAFEQELAENPALAEEVQLHRAEHRAMHLSLLNDLKSNLNEWKVEKESLAGRQGGEARIVPFRRRFLAYAAAACIVLLVGVFATLWLSKPDASALADEYFGDTSPSVRGSGGGAPASIEGALEKIQAKDYAGALTELETLPQDSSGQESLLFLKGECHYRLHEYSAAANAFQQILQSTSSILNRQKAEWYLLLTLLKGGKDKPAFQNLLKGILADPNHVFYYEAEKLKSRL